MKTFKENTGWVRTCQECLVKDFYPKPDPKDKNEKWRDTQCVVCKSTALDYGHSINEVG